MRRIASHCGLWIAYWRLRPLWAVLLQAVPDIELPAEPGWGFGIRWRLLRRVIEVEAAVLMDAVHACMQGRPPSRAPVPERLWLAGGDDLHSEVVRLVHVSLVIRRCPIVRELPVRTARPRSSRRGSRV
jgi:hypothetical protein